ncbi:MAG: hypothetical protein K6T94_01745 [Paenibacillus sp.]|nr:hypothetical protein [Paenibacillus sp.]
MQSIITYGIGFGVPFRGSTSGISKSALGSSPTAQIGEIKCKSALGSYIAG